MRSTYWRAEESHRCPEPLKAIKVELRKCMHDRSLGEADAARASELLRRLGQSPEPLVVL